MIKNKTIDGQLYAQLIISGANNLINNKNRIDDLNVFPVPDGDTGTNMSSTVDAAAKALEGYQNKNLGEVASFVSKNMLYGARGNSGVILSQIFKGFALSFENKTEVDVLGLLEGFKKATERAYQSVLKPVEGTILTVIRETTEELEKKINKNTSFEEFFVFAKDFARVACDNTPNKLKILREVGVVDSGGEGLVMFISGMASLILGNPVSLSNEEQAIDKFISSEEVYTGEFGYCTEFIISLNNPEEFNKEAFQKSLSKKANSLVVVQDAELVKVHGHTIKPGDLLNLGQKYGEFMKIKSENMTLQAEDSRNKNVDLSKTQETSLEPLSKCGVISCNLGTGIINKMNELGCDVIIESGQTQNPSAADIVDAINKCNAENVFILPNNSNIFLTAEQAAQVVSDKKIHIIKTRTQIQGINAMLGFNKDSSPEENEELMNEMVSLVKTGEVTIAVRDTKINGVKIKKDNYLSILDDKIIACKSTYLEAAKYIINKVVNENSELVTIYYGNDASEADASELADYISSKYSCGVEIVDGNQPNYHFLIGLE
ncbi:DAK2 domain-containing protein [Mycoplasmopsis felifaucium]|uniref:DAK2 domain-containing protein n=1 Tax=Mycoplasmopsis felifaucium TaxID=35768 RepID=UPI00048899D0|nr:DAK2 domain-containing protein [Mycoplasmopsis felifaucium]